MAHKVTVNKDNVELPDGFAYNTGTLVTLTDAQFSQIPAGAFTGGSPVLTDSGAAANAGDSVYTQAANIPVLGAKTSAAAAGATPTKAEHDAVVADITTLYAKVNALITAETGTGKPISS